MITKYGQCIRFNESDVRPTGRTSMGVRGMNLVDRDEVIGMQIDSQGTDLLIVSEYGMGKRTSIDEFTAQNRGGKGVKCYKITEKTGNVVGVKAVDEDNEIMIINTEGIIIRMKCDGISELGRVTSGVKLINLPEGDKVACIAKVRKGDESEDDLVERAMRHAIEIAWNRGDFEMQQKIFRGTISGAKGKPTNGEFIALLAEHIALRFKSANL